MLATISKRWKSHHDEKAEAYMEKARKGGIIAVYRLFNRYYLKSFFGPFFAFIFPVLIFAILGSFQNPTLLFSGIAAMSAMGTGLTGMPFTIIELKKSVLLKRIGASPVKAYTFTIVVISYLAAEIFLSVLWLMIWALIIHRNPAMFDSLGSVPGFFGFFYGNILNIILSLTIGFAIATVSKSEVGAQAIGTLLYFPAAFLSGQFISIDNIAGNAIMDVVSRIVPFRYTTMIMVEAWTGDIANMADGAVIYQGNPFLIHEYGRLDYTSLVRINNVDATSMTIDQLRAALATVPGGQNVNAWLASNTVTSFTKVRFYDNIDHILAYIYPYIAIAATGFLTIKRFKWAADR